MVSRVLVAVDGSEVSEQALRYALDAHPDAEVTVLTVVGTPSRMFGQATAIALSDDPDRSIAEHAEPVLERAREVAAESGIEVSTEAAAGHPARTIIDRASDYDVVVVGSHGGSVADRLLVGNVADSVVRHSPVPVTVVR
jgi:nucleotide-binding universal stress UspA family protein